MNVYANSKYIQLYVCDERIRIPNTQKSMFLNNVVWRYTMQVKISKHIKNSSRARQWHNEQVPNKYFEDLFHKKSFLRNTFYADRTNYSPPYKKLHLKPRDSFLSYNYCRWREHRNKPRRNKVQNIFLKSFSRRQIFLSLCSKRFLINFDTG